MKNIIIIFSLILFCSSIFAQTSYTFFYKIRNYQGPQAILYQVKGGENTALDTAKSQQGTFVFYNIEKYPTGVYRVRFDDTLFTEVIFNKEDIVMEADANEVLRSMNVSKSVENQILFDYWRNAMDIRDTIVRKYLEKDAEMKRNNNKPSLVTQKIDREIDFFNDGTYNYVMKLKEFYPNAYATTLLKAYQMPSYSRFLKQAGNQPYAEEKMFYLYHFFDYINFADSRLLNSKVFFTAFNDYLKTFANPPSTQIYIELVDRIMRQAAANPEISKYAINLFVKSFEFSIWEDVFIHVMDNYYLKSATESPYLKAFYSKKVEAMKKLKIGKPFPCFVAQDTAGSSVNICESKANAKIIVFYSSDCEHCLEALPTLKLVVDDYKEDGLLAYGVALDTDKDEWLKVLKLYKLQWNAVSDLKGMASSFLTDYNIWSTPRTFILDKDNIIRALPNGESEIHAALLEVLHLQNKK
jgi:peroxiredoxin